MAGQRLKKVLKFELDCKTGKYICTTPGICKKGVLELNHVHKDTLDRYIFFLKSHPDDWHAVPVGANPCANLQAYTDHMLNLRLPVASTSSRSA